MKNDETKDRDPILKIPKRRFRRWRATVKILNYNQVEERPIRAQFTTNISYLRILRIFQVVQRAVFSLSGKDHTRRNKTKASARGELLNRNATAMAVLESPGDPQQLAPLPEDTQNQTPLSGPRPKPWRRPSPGLRVELARKAPHP